MTDPDFGAQKVALIETCVQELRTLARPAEILRDVREARGGDGLLETREGVARSGRSETLARISYQRFFRCYLRLAAARASGARRVQGAIRSWATSSSTSTGTRSGPTRPGR